MEDILSQYNSSAEGLSKKEVSRRQEKYGPNIIEEKKPTPLIKLYHYLSKEANKKDIKR